MSYFSNCMYFSTNLLARHLNNIANEAFKDLDFTPTQGFTLIAIGQLDKHYPSEIACELEMKPSTITRFLDKLEECGYIVRTYKGRQAKVDLTERGYEIIEKVNECWKKIDDEITDTFGETICKETTKNIVIANQIYTDKNCKK